MSARFPERPEPRVGLRLFFSRRLFAWPSFSGDGRTARVNCFPELLPRSVRARREFVKRRVAERVTEHFAGHFAAGLPSACRRAAERLSQGLTPGQAFSAAVW